ncbi:hypothetical protein [Janthinobacterium sp. PSPC3-1]|uniref:hypothetical protein n=1 Tax=Janthinobacterium sp. PSPC3-1 TaxID=2804653 RepID=UPI003CF031B0
MASLSKAGEELFIAESTALSIIGEMDSNGMLASALHMRHKVREADIEKLLETCAKTPPETYARLLAVAYLMCYSSSAYAEINALVKSHNLKDVNVTPHFGGGSRYLKLACIAEPMNLWTGWALENTKSNQTTFDGHMVDIIVNSVTSIKMTALSNAPSSGQTITTGQTVWNSSFSPNQKLQGTHSFNSSNAPPKLQRTLTPTSEGLQQMLKSDHVYKSSINEGAISGRDDLIKEVLQAANNPGANHAVLQNKLNEDLDKIRVAFKNMKTLALNLNNKGKQHYEELYSQLELRFPVSGRSDIIKSMLDVIKTAYHGWIKNRNILETELDQVILALGSKSPVPFVFDYINGWQHNASFYLRTPYK